MEVKVTPCAVNGSIKAIASKSDAHRAIICAALSDKKTSLHISETSQDIIATLSCMQAFGAKILKNGTEYIIEPVEKVLKNAVINCNESGSTLRFLLPVAAALGCGAKFLGQGRLPERPMGLIIDLLAEHGISFSAEKLPFEIEGKLTPGEFKIEGNVSSQFISGLMFALPLLDEKSKITLLSPLQSEAYVEMTISVLEKFGVRIERVEDGFLVNPVGKFLTPGEYMVEGDWSNSAFFLVAAALSGNVKMTGLDFNSKQSDKAILDILKLAGADFEVDNESISVKKSNLVPFSLDVSQFPDLFPITAILACGAVGKTTLFNAARLRIKESDRIVTTRELIEGLGGKAEETEDSLIIYGSGKLSGGRVLSANDHRIAMSAYAASCICDKEVILSGAEAVRKSYPDFIKDFESLGGKTDVI